MAKQRKEEKLSPRQRQSKQFMREKELQIKRQQFRRKLWLSSIALISILLVSGGFWVWKTSAISHALQATSDKIYSSTVQAGYAVKNIYLEGRNRTPIDEINQALDIDKNAPILELKLEEIRTRLEKIESIKYAAIERALPDTLYVRVVERDPVALWQYQGKITLVDDNGVVMNGLDTTPYKTLPLIVGEDAPKHVVDLLKILTSQPELAKRFVAAIWVGERRWNIRLKPKKATPDGEGNIEVQLPEKDSLGAWKKLAELQKKQQLLDRDVKVIDLRIDGKLFIKLPEGEITTKTSNAKDI